MPRLSPVEPSNVTAPSDSIPARFANAVAQFASRVAVSAPTGQWTYAELNRRSSLVASQILRQLGEASEPVALLMEHDAPLIAAILGTVRANKIYLALDTAHPPEQLATMLARSGAKLLLADGSNLAVATTFASEQLQVLPVAEKSPTDYSPATCPEISPDAGAWLMFTSGSTNAPKGVWQSHQGIAHEAETYAELINLTPEDRVSLLTSCSLSASGATLFATLFSGAALCLFHVRSQGVQRLAEWLPRERITIFHSVPSIFRRLARAAEGKNSFDTIRLIRLGGEPVFSGDVDAFRRLCPDSCRLMQSLSSTETGMIATLMMDKQTVLQNARVPAGSPVPGVEVILFGEDNKPVKDGTEGKIAVRSARLRQGYWWQPEQTASSFLADSRDPRFHIFVSNDLGRFLPGGVLEHLGRADQMVKVRGQRVDLGEVEAALLTTELVKEAAVSAHETTSGDKRLTAYVVPCAGADVTPQNFRRELRRQLPEHMIPADFIVLDKLPRTVAGKIDRRALPAPRAPENKNVLDRGNRPRDVVDKRLVQIWETALNLSPISRKDDFFELGGTSLQSVEVLLHIEELFGVSLPPSTLVEYSTIEKLAAHLSDYAVIPSPSPLVMLREGGAGRPLFLIHSGQGDVTSYGLLARRLTDRPVFGLQSVALQGESWPLKSVPAMARRYLPEILAKDPTGPYLLAGTCMGGIIAFELAQMLVQQGKKVGLVGLLDTFYPTPTPKHPDRQRRIYISIRTPVHYAWAVLRWKIARALGLGRNSRLMPAWRRFVVSVLSRTNRSYRPVFYPGEITVFISDDTKFTHEDPRLMIQSKAQAARVIRIPGDRIGLFARPAVDELARQMQTAMESGVSPVAGRCR